MVNLIQQMIFFLFFSFLRFATPLSPTLSLTCSSTPFRTGPVRRHPERRGERRRDHSQLRIHHLQCPDVVQNDVDPAPEIPTKNARLEYGAGKAILNCPEVKKF